MVWGELNQGGGELTEKILIIFPIFFVTHPRGSLTHASEFKSIREEFAFAYGGAKVLVTTPRGGLTEKIHFFSHLVLLYFEAFDIEGSRRKFGASLECALQKSAVCEQKRCFRFGAPKP